MKLLLKSFTVLILPLMLFLGVSGFAFAEKIEDLKSYNYVNDYAEILNAKEELTLNQKLSTLEQTTGAQVAIVTVNSMEGDYIEHYAVKLFEAWNLGDKKLDNGALLLISISDRKMRLEVGYGLESVLSDGWSSYILNELVQPAFKRGEYSIGIDGAVDTISSLLQGQVQQIPDTNKNNPWLAFVFNLAPFIFIFSFAALEWLAAILGRTKSWWLGGFLGATLGAAVILVIGVSLVTEIVTIVLAIFGFIFDYFVSRNYSLHKSGINKGPPDWWSGGTWGPGGSTWSGASGGSSWGGFGGGSSGGGGASSSW